MTADPVLTLAWLVLAHLVADFVLQTDGIVAAKTATGSRAWRGLLAHGLGVAGCLVPVALAFGQAGLWVLVAVTAGHVAIDRAKVLATRRAAARALEAARRRHEGPAAAAGLGRAWTPLPAAWFVLDQLAHLAVLGAAWATWLAGTAPTAGWTTAATSALGGWDQSTVHRVALVGVVLAGLLIANVRGGALLVATLVRPLESATGADAVGEPVPASAPPAAAARRWSFRIGPLAGRIEAEPGDPEAAAAGSGRTAATATAGDHATAPAAQVGATIGVLERLLIVTFVLVGAEAVIGFVIAAKTIARFRLLDDRDFAEYYLLGTLASVSIAIVTALVARAAIGG